MQKMSPFGYTIYAWNGSSGHDVDRGCTAVAIVPCDACKRCHSRKKLLHAAQNEDVLGLLVVNYDSSALKRSHDAERALLTC